MKQFMKILSIDGNCFKYLILKFPNLPFEKVKASVFHGLKIWQLIDDEHLIRTMTELQKNVCCVKKHSKILSWKYATRTLYQNCPSTFRELQKTWLQYDWLAG